MEFINKFEGTSYRFGIYKIKSVNEKIYVGSASSLKMRYFTHRNDLTKNKHDNSRLQNYVNKYGIESVSFHVLEYCDKKDLLVREQFYIDSINPFFNIARVAGATYGLKPWLGKKHSEETKLKIKQSNIDRFNIKGRKIKPKKLSLEENLLRFTLINKTPERRKEISERQKGNTYWLGKKHKPETIENRMGNKNPNSIHVRILELNMSFTTLKDCAKYLNVGPSAICNSISRGNKVHSKYTICRI